MLKFYSASNGLVHSKKAMYDCLASALKEQDAQIYEKQLLIVIHSTIGHNFQDLLDAALEKCPNATIAGCTCAGVIGIEGANENMRALAIMIVEPEKDGEFFISSCKNIRGENSYDEAQKMAQELYAKSVEINMIHILASGIDIAADRAIEGIASVFGNDIPVFGGTSSDNTRAISSYQFINNTILERGAIMIGYADPTLSVEMGVHHGNRPIGHSFTVSRSEANRVYELNNETSWYFLMDKLNLPHHSHPGPCIPVAAIAEALPEEFHESYDNQFILRAIVKVDDDGSFYMPVDCPEQTELWLTQRDEQIIFSGLESMLERLVEQIGNQQIVGIFHTDCAARGRAMFNQIVKDEIIEAMQSPFMKEGSIPWLGMYGFGEFTRLNNKNLFHNYTTSIYALVRKNEG